MRAVISRTLMKAIIIAFTGHFVLLIYLGLVSMLSSHSSELNIDPRLESSSLLVAKSGKQM